MSRARDPHPEAGPSRAKVVRLTPRPRREAESEDAPHFAEMIAATNYSFLRGASHPSDMVAEAIALGHKAIGIADRNTVAGVVRAYVALKNAREKCAVDAEEKDRAEETAEEAERRRVVAREAMPIVGAFRLVVGARLCFADGTPDIVAYPINRHGWGRLTRLLSSGNRKEGVKKGNCDLRLADLLDHAQDMLLIAVADEADEATLVTLAQAVPGSLWLTATMPRGGRDRRRLARLGRLADRIGIPLLATCDALYATPDQRALHDIVTCIREGKTIAEAGRLLQANAERHLKPAREMARLFRDRPEAVGAWADILTRIGFTLVDLKYEYPHEPVPEGWEPQAWLEHETLRLAGERYPDGIPDKIRISLGDEFRLIRDWKYACYFLTVYDAVKFARDKGILCQGRGSAANSAVCYYLGITSVDPAKHDLLFSRFISEDRDEPPDIDVDFEHERREEVIQHIYQRYGRERAAIAATVIHYRPRSTVREVGKALGLSEDVTSRLTSTVWGSFTRDMEARRYTDNGFDPAAPDIARLRAIVDQLLEFPRHLSQHVGGFVLTQDRLDETVPIHNGAMEDRTFIEWDKEDIDALKLMKVDVLALGMLTCIRKGFDLMRRHGLGDHDLTLGGRDDDPAVYDMLCKGDSIGVFQVESRAQINMLPRLQPRTFYDLAIQVAIVRPGPIEGDMVHPYLKRREEEREGRPPTWHFPKPALLHPQNELYGVLGKTFGVPLFQEQAMKLAITAAGFKPSEANQLRRAMATFRNVGTIGNFEEKMVGGMVSRGYDQDFAQRCYNQIKGFGSYGFPESHAISFARLVYVSSWLKCFHPAVFACALLNSQPMGFYAPAQIVRDARDHAIEVRAADINASDWDNSLERRAGGDHALRIGLRQIDGFREDWALRLMAVREAGPFGSIEELARRAALPSRGLRLLADADACRSIGLDRRQALWEVRRTPGDVLPLFAAADARELAQEADTPLPVMPLPEHVVTDYQTTRLSLKDHPMRFLRDHFREAGVSSSADLATAKNGAFARAAGLVLVRQRPGKGNAIFVTIEDETGIVNVLIWARLFEIQRRLIMAARLMQVEGEIQRSKEGVIHLMANRVIDRTDALDLLTREGLGLKGQQPDRAHHPRNVRILPASRDFH